MESINCQAASVNYLQAADNYQTACDVYLFIFLKTLKPANNMTTEKPASECTEKELLEKIATFSKQAAENTATIKAILVITVTIGLIGAVIQF